jgi:hypothetical protein
MIVLKASKEIDFPKLGTKKKLKLKSDFKNIILLMLKYDVMFKGVVV